MLKILNQIKLITIISLLITFIFVLSLLYTSSWFTMIIIINKIKITFNWISIFVVVIFALMEYKEYNKKSINEFYHFIFWLLCFIGIGGLIYNVYTSLLVKRDSIPDYMVYFETIQVQIEYTYKFKVEWFF